jgi:hypothetical protein
MEAHVPGLHDCHLLRQAERGSSYPGHVEWLACDYISVALLSSLVPMKALLVSFYFSTCVLCVPHETIPELYLYKLTMRQNRHRLVLSGQAER